MHSTNGLSRHLPNISSNGSIISKNDSFYSNMQTKSLFEKKNTTKKPENHTDDINAVGKHFIILIINYTIHTWKSSFKKIEFCLNRSANCLDVSLFIAIKLAIQANANNASKSLF